MPNRNYCNGAAFERKVVNRFRSFKDCKFAARTAGSHSPFDVVALVGNKLYLIQCKANDLTDGEKRKIIREMPVLEKKVQVFAQLRFRRKRHEIVVDLL